MASTIQVEVKNWRDLIRIEEEYSLNRDRKEWVYRGQLLKDPLWSTLERAFNDFAVLEDDRAQIEDRILMDFQRSCHVYAPAAVPEEQDIMAWFSLMRHYGAPARILDFTYSLFIAAYFAVVAWKPPVDAQPPNPDDLPVVWAINRTWLTDYLRDHVLAKLPKAERANLERSWLDPRDHEMFHRLFLERTSSDPMIKGRDPRDTDFAAVLNTFRTNDRILVQQGLFLSATNIRKPLQEQLEAMDGYPDNVVQILITSGAYDILARLYRTGVNSALLSPGLQGFSESLRSKILTYREIDNVRDPDQKWRTRAKGQSFRRWARGDFKP